MLKLRPYQEQAILTARQVLSTEKVCSLVANCGSGKTIIAMEVCWLAFQQATPSSPRRCLIIVPFQSLLDQFAATALQQGFKGTKRMYETFLDSNPDHTEIKATYDRLCRTKGFNNPEVSFYAGSKSEKGLESAHVIIAMAQTIESRGLPDLFFSHIFFDESHLTYFRRELHVKLNEYKHYKTCKEILFTATPWRGDGACYPDGVEHHLVVATHEQIVNGFNAPYRYFPMGTLEVHDALRYRDFSEQEEIDQLNKQASPEKAWEMLSQPNQHCESSTGLDSVFDQRTIFFFSRKNIALKYMEYFRLEMALLGIERELILVCDATSNDDRIAAYKKFRNKQALLFTVTCLAIGFDEPSVENIVLLRTFSKGGFALFIQILGRGLRISPATDKTECRMYDLCANPYFPLPSEITSWDDGTIPEKPDGRECPECGTISGRAMKSCYKCGFDLPKPGEKPEKILTETDKLLQSFAQACNSEQEKPAEQAQRELQQLLGVQDTRKFIERLSIAGRSPEFTYRIYLKLAVLLLNNKPGWAYFQFKKIFPDLEPEFNWKKHAIFGDNPTFGNYRYYREFLRKCYGSQDAKANSKVFGALRDEFRDYNHKFHEQYLLLPVKQCDVMAYPEAV